MKLPMIQQNSELQQSVDTKELYQAFHMQPLFTTKGQMWVYELLSKEVA